VPGETQKKRAHSAIERTLDAGVPQNLNYVGQIDQPDDPYEIWPQKLSAETFWLLQQHRMTALPLPNGDYPFTQEGGLLVMAKLADACAGSLFARVTDRLMAYGMIGSGEQQPGNEAEVVPITLDLIDASSVPLEHLIALRRREQSERNGSDYTKLRHSYADKVQEHIAQLGAALDAFERDELTRQFRARMRSDLQDLRKELGCEKVDLVLKPVVIASVVATGTMLTTSLGLPAALAAGAAAAIGTDLKEIAKAVADFVKEGFNFDRKQQQILSAHPMAYMYELSSIRAG
jgi:hypothetical protein